MVVGTRHRSDQLTLPMDLAQGVGALPRRITPMLPGRADAPFDDEGTFFEPWWPGTHCVAFIEDGELRLQIDHLTDPLAAFPELRVIAGQVTAGAAILDGTLLVLDVEGRPDVDLLRRQLADPTERRGEGAFVASDLLWADGQDITALPFEARRARLLGSMRDGDRGVVGRGLRGEGETLAEAVASMGIAAISARRLDARWRPGPAGDAWLRIPVTQEPVTPTRPLLVLLQRLPLDG